MGMAKPRLNKRQDCVAKGMSTMQVSKRRRLTGSRLRRLRFAETVESVHGEFPARGRASSADISLSVEVPDDLRETKGAVRAPKYVRRRVLKL